MLNQIQVAAQHAHAVRPLRARDRALFEAFVYSALAAADAQSVGPHFAQLLPIAARHFIHDSFWLLFSPIIVYPMDRPSTQEYLMAHLSNNPDRLAGLALKATIRTFLTETFHSA